MATKTIVTEEQQRTAEQQIKERQKEVKYDLRDFTVDYIVREFREEFFYVPIYQRKFIWPESHRCRFIESIILGLPIPMMFVADMEDGRLEIVDGAQRIQTLEAFLNNDLQLSGLERLPNLNGFRFLDLPLAQQRKLGTRALRMVVLEDATTPDTRQEIFNRVNTSGVKARPSEIRGGAYTGPFMTFITECAQDPLFLQLCPISASLLMRREGEELTLRFFAYSDEYHKFRHDVDRFLDRYASEHQRQFARSRLEAEFRRMLDFVRKFFPYGFAKNRRSRTTPRVRFEAIAVGVNLALRKNPLIVPEDMAWLDSSDFAVHTTTHASNSGPRLRGRVEYVRDQLLKSV